VFAALRDRTADADEIQNLTLFIEKSLGSDGAGANAIRKTMIASHI
jgi:hypothetical protein